MKYKCIVCLLVFLYQPSFADENETSPALPYIEKAEALYAKGQLEKAEAMLTKAREAVQIFPYEAWLGK